MYKNISIINGGGTLLPSYCSFWNEICMGFLKWHLFTDFNQLFKMKHPDPCYKGPDHLKFISTNNRQFSNITSFYLKITSCRWLKENNRLLFSVTGIDNQSLKLITYVLLITKICVALLSHTYLLPMYTMFSIYVVCTTWKWSNFLLYTIYLHFMRFFSRNKKRVIKES